jgi:hypothetical protein
MDDGRLEIRHFGFMSPWADQLSPEGSPNYCCSSSKYPDGGGSRCTDSEEAMELRGWSIDHDQGCTVDRPCVNSTTIWCFLENPPDAEEWAVPIWEECVPVHSTTTTTTTTIAPIKYKRIVSLYKPTTSDSYANSGPPGALVDGNHNDGVYTNHLGGSNAPGTCFHGGKWWQVDLEEEYDISMIVIHGRSDNCCDQSNNLEVRVGNIGDNLNDPVCKSGVNTHGKEVGLTCDTPLKGRYVTVTQKGWYTDLVLCEVSVYSTFTVDEAYRVPKVCAEEDGWCEDCFGEVSYGTRYLWSKKVPTAGRIKCNNNAFGDPAPGEPKICLCWPGIAANQKFKPAKTSLDRNKFTLYGSGICKGTDAEFNVLELAKSNPNYDWIAEPGWAVAAIAKSGNVNSIYECAEVCHEVDGCKFFSKNGPTCGAANFVGHDFSEGATDLAYHILDGAGDVSELDLDKQCCEKCSEHAECEFWVRSTGLYVKP